MGFDLVVMLSEYYRVWWGLIEFVGDIWGVFWYVLVCDEKDVVDLCVVSGWRVCGVVWWNF